MSRHIEVWHDETSDHDAPAWCVSLCEADGEEVACLSAHEDRADATRAGEEAARRRKLDLRVGDGD